MVAEEGLENKINVRSTFIFPNVSGLKNVPMGGLRVSDSSPITFLKKP